MEQQTEENHNIQETKVELKVERRLMNYRFWLFVTLSLLFIITFVYYLPLRFQSSEGDHTDMMGDQAHNGAINNGHADLPSIDALKRLALKTPANRVDRLPFTDKDGVKEFRLEAQEFRWEMANGKWAHVWGYNGQIPGPEIRVNEGDNVRVIVKNSLPDSTSVHWHGIDVPWEADGVPGVTQNAIKPVEEFIYEFTAKPAGTHFYHTHGKDHQTAAQQLDMGLSGAFIIEPNITPYTLARIYNNEFTLVLDEWNIMPNGQNMAASHLHGAFEMDAVPEFNTFTINGRVFPDTDPINIKPGDNVLIRFINAGTSDFHPMHLHGHNFQVIALDGNLLPFPEIRNTVTVHPGETLDILISANNPGPSWLLHCHHVHHASAGMITLLKYEGVESITPLQ